MTFGAPPPLDRFDLRRFLGSGSMGTVYEAYDRMTDQTVAAKVLRDVTPQRLYRFKQEFRTAQTVSHANLVSLGELVLDRGRWLFTMELLDGEDIRSWVTGGRGLARIPGDTSTSSSGASGRGGGGGEEASTRTTRSLLAAGAPGATPLHGPPVFDEARLRRAFGQVALGVAALHAAGQVHRDIKPSNILVTGTGRAVLVDFGLATTKHDLRQPTDSVVVGTIAYMAPEQGAGAEPSPPADWYAVGAVLYECLTGRLPFRGPPLSVLVEKQSAQPTPVQRVAPGIPDDLASLCMDLLAPRPSRRPEASEVLARLGLTATARRMMLAASSTNSVVGAAGLGRARELATIERAWRRVSPIHPVAVFISGFSGVGKSDLLQHATRQLRALDDRAVVFFGRAVKNESVPFQTVDGLIDDLSRLLRRMGRDEVQSLVPPDVESLRRVFLVMGRVGAFTHAETDDALPAPQDGSGELRARAFGALRWIFAELARRAPLILAIDDAHWLDADSATLLDAVLGGPKPPGLFLLLAGREGPVDVPLPADAVFVHLGPLAREAAEEVTRHTLQSLGIAHRVSAATLAAASSGYPAYIDVMCRYVALAGDQELDLDPSGVDDMLWAHATSLGADALRLAEFASVAEAPLAATTLRVASGLPEREFDELLAKMRVTHLLRNARRPGEVEPHHARLARAVRERIAPEVLTELHRRLAQAIETTGSQAGHADILIRHLDAAGEYERAARYAEEAAARASEGFAFDQAASFLRTALGFEGLSVALRQALRMRLARALLHAGDLPGAGREFAACAQDAPPALALEARREASLAFLFAGHIREGLVVLDSIREEVGVPLPRTHRAAILSIIKDRAALILSNYGWTPRDASEIAPADLERWEVYRSVSLSLAIVDNVRAQAVQARGLRHALWVGEPTRALRSLMSEAAFVSSLGKRWRRRGQAILERHRALAEAGDDALAKALLVIAEGTRAYFEGALDRCIERLERGTVLAQQAPDVTWGELHVVRTIWVLALRRRGHYRRLREAVDALLAEAKRRGDRYTTTTITRFAMMAWLARGELDEAVDRLAAARWSANPDHYHQQHYGLMIARADLALYQGAVGAAELAEHERRYREFWAAPLRRTVSTVRAEATWVWGRLNLAMPAGLPADEVAARLSAARKAARVVCKTREPYAQAWGKLLVACVAAAAGADPKPALLVARRAAQAADLPHLAAAAGVRLAGLERDAHLAATLRSEARDLFAEECVTAPGRVVQALTPGFPATGEEDLGAAGAPEASAHGPSWPG